MKIGSIQMNSSDSVQENLSLTESLLIQATYRKVEIVLLPENFAFMGYPKQLVNEIMEDYGDGPIQTFLKEQSKQLGISIIAGSIPIKNADESRSFARSIAYDDQGNEIAYYDKIHLFDVEVNGKAYNESASIEAGRDVINFMTGSELNVKVGLSICYDVRFPELYRQLGEIDIITVPAAFTYETGQAHWHTLLASRAIENLCYVVGSAQWGEHYGNRKTYGHSMIVDPWGEIKDELPVGNGLVVSEIDLDHLAEIRSKFPALSHRRSHASHCSNTRHTAQ